MVDNVEVEMSSTSTPAKGANRLLCQSPRHPSICCGHREVWRNRWLKVEVAASSTPSRPGSRGHVEGRADRDGRRVVLPAGTTPSRRRVEKVLLAVEDTDVVFVEGRKVDECSNRSCPNGLLVTPSSGMLMVENVLEDTSTTPTWSALYGAK